MIDRCQQDNSITSLCQYMLASQPELNIAVNHAVLFCESRFLNAGAGSGESQHTQPKKPRRLDWTDQYIQAAFGTKLLER